MTSEEYYDLVKKYESQHRQSPTVYRWKLYFLALVGYAFVTGALLVNAALLAALVWIHRNNGLNGWIVAGYVIVGFTLWSTIRSLFFRIPFPYGVILPKRNFPWIHSRIKKLRKPLKLGFKKIHVAVNWDFNASAATRPLFGFFGPSVHRLTLGLPLLNTLNQPQLDALLAHELAHFSRKHTSSSIWIGRVRSTWIDLLIRLRKMPVTGFMFVWFAKWFSKYFEAASVVLVRENEYEADHLAASATSAKACAELILRLEMRAGLVAKYWERVWRRPLLSRTVDQTAVSRLVNTLNEPLKREEMLRSLRWSLGNETHFFDSHPSLPDRLRSLGIDLPADESSLSDFADSYSIQNAATTLAKVLEQEQYEAEQFMDAVWEVIHGLPWAIRNAEGGTLTEMDAALEKGRRELGSLSPERMWKKAWLKNEIYGPEQAEPLIDLLLKRSPDHPHANFFRGAQLLEQYDAEGILYLEKAMELDPLSHQQAGLTVLSDFYRRMGSHDDAENSRRESFAAGDETEKAFKERGKPVSIKDRFKSHRMNEEQIEDLEATFKSIPEIKKVLIVSKRVKHMPDTPYHILGIIPTFAGLFRSESTDVELLMNIAISSSHQIVILPPKRILLRFLMRRVENSLVYRRERWRARRKRMRLEAQKEK